MTFTPETQYPDCSHDAGMYRWRASAIVLFAALAVLLGLVAVAGAAFSTPVNLSAPGQDAGPSQIASDADGDAVAVWERFNRGVRARTISAAGALGPIRTLAGQDAVGAQVASDADGGAVAVWNRHVGSNWGVQARTISAAGVLGPTRTLSDAVHGAYAPQIASDADGDAVAVWSLSGSIQTRTISAAGALGPTKTLSAAGQLYALNPQIASDADGDAVAVWEAFDDPYDRPGLIQARTISAAGVVGPTTTLSAAHGYEAQVASDAAGGAVAVWSHYSESSNRRVRARTISAAGVLGQIRSLSAAGPYTLNPQIASDADGDAVAVWSLSGRVQARMISAAGVVEPTKTLSWAGRHAFDPQIASDADGDAVAIWSRKGRSNVVDGINFRIQARTISAAGVLGATKTLSAAGQDARGPQIASDADGDVVAVWSRRDGSNLRIQASQGP